MSKRHFVFTGPPGIGKTTIIKKVCDSLKKLNIPLRGFYTEELRSGNTRVGFDVVTLDGERGSLARVSSDENQRFKVGKYKVTVSEFELIALPLLKEIQDSSNDIVVLDEIGKMEVFSEAFVRSVGDIMKNSNRIILATIPVPKGRPIPIVESIRTNVNTKLIEVVYNNRDRLPDVIVNEIIEFL